MKKILVALVLSIATPAFADETPVPKCEGKDKAAANRDRALGLQHYRASKRSGANDPEMTSALGFFDAACAAGDDTALELRAYALAGLERYVEAAKSLDAFLAAHPVDTLPDDVKDRVEAQAPEILRHVASLSITSKPDGARVSINHRPVGTTPIKDIRLTAGTYDFEVVSDAGTQKRTAALVDGANEESFDFTPKTDDQPPPPPPPVVKDKGKSSLMPLVITAGALAVASGAVGIIGGVMSSGASSSYNDKMCGLKMAPTECKGLLSDANTGFTIEIIGFIGAGVFAAATGVLFVMEATKDKKPKAEGLHCAPGIGGGMCTYRF